MTVARRLTSRRGARLTLLLALLASIALIGALRGADSPSAALDPPADAESTQVARQLERLPDSDIQPVLLVATRDDGADLSPADVGALRALGAAVQPLADHPASPPIVSEDGAAAIVQVPVRVAAENADNAETITTLRERVAAERPDGLTVAVTGGPAFGADIAKAFDGADVRLLLVTIGIVALLLLLTYRSPILWLVPLSVVGIADQVAAVVTAALGEGLGWQFDAGIISVLVFGAGTNYALLLISRYREELGRTADHRAALADAWRASVPAIVASNLTVVLALTGLVLAAIPSTRGLGLAAAVGLLIALAAALAALPAALAMCGRRVFWPFVPRAHHQPHDGGEIGTPGPSHGADMDATTTSVWGRVATTVVRRPTVVTVSAVALLVVMATGLVGTSVGLTQTERFRVASESADGLTTLGRHFPAGEAQPLTVTTSPDHVAQVSEAVTGVEGVRSVRPGPATAGLATVTVVTTPTPGSAQALDAVREVRAAAHAVPGAGALVGGAQAADVDTRDASRADLWLVVPVILLVNALVLGLLLRSLVAPVVLLAVNVLSALAAIGAGSWLTRVLFDQPALDLQVPLLAFLFLVALGIDYTMFLMHRAREEAQRHGTRAGVVQAVSHTGAVITSAGLVLAGVFAALGVLPLVTLGQLGLIVGLGVLVDTFVVRTLLVPGLVTLAGDRIWWPGAVASGATTATPRSTRVRSLEPVEPSEPSEPSEPVGASAR